MAYDQNVQYLSLAFWQIIMTAGPILAIALGIGLLIGLIQAATSIQEMTLSFVPKLFVVLAAMALFAPYTLSALTDYFSFIFEVKFWLLDEPSNDLDEKSILLFKELINNFLKTNGTIILTTHDSNLFKRKHEILDLDLLKEKKIS